MAEIIKVGNMQITLISHTEHPEITCAKAAWLCTHSEARTKFGHGDACEFVERVLGYGHYSIARHATFTLRVEGISRACSHQLVRHTMLDYSQQSQRYVAADTADFGYKPGYDELCYYPESIRNATPAIQQHYHRGLKVAHQEYAALISCGIAPEDARYLLPNAEFTKITITGNGQAWREYLTTRLCKTTQTEHRFMAEGIHKLLVNKFPALFLNVAPDCKNCTERNKCDGKSRDN